MIIEFSFGNYLSFKERKKLSMVASNIKELVEENTINTSFKFKLLKSAVIYGANASGKSNIIKAFRFFRNYIINSAKNIQYSEQIPVENFMLSDNYDKLPSYFEMVFIIDKTRYRYGYEIDSTKIYKEWLYFVPNKIESLLFERTNQEYHIGNFLKKDSKGITDKTKENTLFLSALSQWNSGIAKKLFSYFKRINIISGLNERGYLGYTLSQCEIQDFKNSITNFIKNADLNINDFEIENKDVTFDDLPNTMPEPLKALIAPKDKGGKGKITNIYTLHNKYNDKHEITSTVKFDLDENESDCTKKLFALTGPIVDTLNNGKTLIIDELDSRLHPLLTQFIVKLFNSQITNPNNAQLIFASHDTSILDKRYFRRDQVWFTEKDPYGASDLYSLQDYKIDKYKKIRNDASYAKDYILGKYGAIPFINNNYSLLK